MADTFSQLYIQVVFAVKGREALIDSIWEIKLHKYISGLISNKKQKLLAINGMPDHIHILIGITPSCCISDLMREIKKSSINYIKEQRFTKFNFQWQEGYGAFSYSRSELPNLIAYVNNQKEHHKKIIFKEEYKNLLKVEGAEYKEEHLFS